MWFHLQSLLRGKEAKGMVLSLCLQEQNTLDVSYVESSDIVFWKKNSSGKRRKLSRESGLPGV